ncbi:GNAT family N-acetyltransferase [Pendulispora albinea]|uniref:GNAT family N-acetyltransferase n=1 Tax=Pendulispora albinea TaxID=2741071 RepID=A0ABZ2LTC2_9BACT
MRSHPDRVPPPPIGTILRTSRLVLRVGRDSDVSALLRASRRNQDYLRPWSPAPPAGQTHPTLTSAANEIARDRTLWKLGTNCAFFVFPAQEETPRIIGRIALSNIARRVFQNAYLGYWMDRGLQGRGLMSEAVDAVVDFAFGPLGLHRVQAAVMPRNPGSMRVLEKCGFRREGYAVRYLKIAGNWEDHVLFALTREERSDGADEAP